MGGLTLEGSWKKGLTAGMPNGRQLQLFSVGPDERESRWAAACPARAHSCTRTLSLHGMCRMHEQVEGTMSAVHFCDPVHCCLQLGEWQARCWHPCNWMLCRYGMTQFVASMNQVVLGQQAKLPPTDSRQRPDLSTLEQGRVKEVPSCTGSIQCTGLFSHRVSSSGVDAQAQLEGL